MAATIAVAAGFLAQPGPSSADVTAVTGSGAFGAQGSISLFKAPPAAHGPVPTVTLPAEGGDQTQSVPSITFAAGPANFLTSGEATVRSTGTTGPGGSVTSTATVQNLNVGETTATTLSSTCTASEAGISGSTTVTGGQVPTVDPTPATPGDAEFTAVPNTPAPNTTFNGFVPDVPADRYRVVFNEQTRTDTSITVNAAHFYLGEDGGGAATGEIIVGQSRCNIAATGVTTTLPTGVTTTQPTGVTTTQPTGVTTTLPAVTTTLPGVNTTRPSGVTTSTILNTVPPAPGPLFGSINVSDLIRQIVCPILQQLAADPFLRPFIEPFLVAFGCTA